MKSLLALFLFSTSALACPHSQQQFICPGDRIVDAYNREGTVVAVNPFQQTVSYHLDVGGTDSESVSDLALGAGCLEAFCVGDRIVDAYNRTGRVIAVNPYSGNVSYHLDVGGVDTEATTDLKVGYGCTMGYCVGDGIIDAYNRVGLIIALSPYDDSVAYHLSVGGVDSEAVTDLSNTKFCQDYGDQFRHMHRYPAMPSAKYRSSGFHYYDSRK